MIFPEYDIGARCNSQIVGDAPGIQTSKFETAEIVFSRRLMLPNVSKVSSIVRCSPVTKADSKVFSNNAPVKELDRRTRDANYICRINNDGKHQDNSDKKILGLSNTTIATSTDNRKSFIWYRI